ncbi:MAG: peptidylprolyl isomerase [Gammaproteobacteria bacterium]
MNKRALPLVFNWLPVFLIAVLAVSIAHGETTPNKVIAIVNGTNLSASDLESFIATRVSHEQLASFGQNPQFQQQMLEEFIDRELIYQDAVKNGLDKSEAFLSEIESIRRTLLTQHSLRHVANNPVSEDSLNAIYKQQFGKSTTEYKARHILVETEDEAVEVIEKLNKGAAFADIAKEKSVDASSQEGGELGWFSDKMMVKPFSDATAALQKGRYTKSPVQTQYGWHVILLEDTREVAPPSMDAVMDKLKTIAQKSLISEHIASLRKNGKVEIKQ